MGPSQFFESVLKWTVMDESKRSKRHKVYCLRNWIHKSKSGPKNKNWTVFLIWIEWYLRMKVEGFIGFKSTIQKYKSGLFTLTNDRPVWLKFVHLDERCSFVWSFTLRTIYFYPFGTFTLELNRCCYQYHPAFLKTNRCIHNQATIGWNIRNRGRLNLNSFEN